MVQNLFTRFVEFALIKGQSVALASSVDDLLEGRKAAFLTAPQVGQEFLDEVKRHPEWLTSKWDRWILRYLQAMLRPHTAAEIDAFMRMQESQNELMVRLMFGGRPLRKLLMIGAEATLNSTRYTTLLSYYTAKHVVNQLRS